MIKAELVQLDRSATRRAGQRAYEVAVTTHGRSTGYALFTQLLAQVSLKNDLTTDRPPYLIPAIDPKDRSRIFLIPSLARVGSQAIKLYYYRSSCRFSLFRLFKGLSLLPLAGHRDVYTVGATSQLVNAGEAIGYALFLPIDGKVTEKVRHSDVTLLKRQVRALERKARRVAAIRRFRAQAEAAAASISRDGSRLPAPDRKAAEEARPRPQAGLHRDRAPHLHG